MIDHERIKLLVERGRYSLKLHLLIRKNQRKLRIEDIIQVIMKGEIIEEYPDDKPFPSCLIHYHRPDRKHLHVVCALSPDDIVPIITAYEPHPDGWIDYKKRRKK